MIPVRYPSAPYPNAPDTVHLTCPFCSLVLLLQTVVYPDYAPYFQAHGSPALQRAMVSMIRRVQCSRKIT